MFLANLQIVMTFELCVYVSSFMKSSDLDTQRSVLFCQGRQSLQRKEERKLHFNTNYLCSFKGSKLLAPNTHFLQAEINSRLLSACKCYPLSIHDCRFWRSLDPNQYLTFKNMMSETDKQCSVLI